ncbi:hypothetical protein IEI94_06265 [Halomonas sp. ML-15]|uniref:hypothetical protein n=1 Tax=Halomonas sp. ML-15 TaxID=2773305 RepID=UPI0017479215|nr:hypothetical protein [Halomonas sp. ML-15]MBD3895453.1 hypothetical protein [Halomonas sp. ML-15]
MTTFDSALSMFWRSLPLFPKFRLKDIITGKIQLPDFQRGWVSGGAWRAVGRTTKIRARRPISERREAP